MGIVGKSEPKRTTETADGRIVLDKRPAKRNCLDCEEEDDAVAVDVVVVKCNNNNNTVMKEKKFDAEYVFLKAKREVDAAQEFLLKAQQNLIEVRQQIRLKGFFELDSLLYLTSGDGSNGEDYLLSFIFDYMDFKNAAICSTVCKRFRNNLIQNYWSKAEKKLDLIDTVLSSPNARNSMERVIKYSNASEEAKRIAKMGDSISKHLVVDCIDEYGDLDQKRIANCCLGCDFPERLNYDMFGPDNIRDDNYDLFVRFSRTKDNFLFSEGFIDHQIIENNEIGLNRFDFSKWKKIKEFTFLVDTEAEDLVETGGDIITSHQELLFDCMKELTITVVAVHKITSRSSLVLAQCNFSKDIDNMGNHGSCWTVGKASAKSHGPVETRSYVGTYGDYSENIESEGSLGMLFDTFTYGDQENEDRHLPPVCFWSLNLDVDIRVTPYSSSDSDFVTTYDTTNLKTIGNNDYHSNSEDDIDDHYSDMVDLAVDDEPSVNETINYLQKQEESQEIEEEIDDHYTDMDDLAFGEPLADETQDLLRREEESWQETHILLERTKFSPL